MWNKIKILIKIGITALLLYWIWKDVKNKNEYAKK